MRRKDRGYVKVARTSEDQSASSKPLMKVSNNRKFDALSFSIQLGPKLIISKI